MRISPAMMMKHMYHPSAATMNNNAPPAYNKLLALLPVLASQIL